MTKPGRLAAFMAEEVALDAEKDKGTTESSIGIPGPLETKKTVQGRGRPKSKPESKLASFHLALSLIAKIEKEADEIMVGNKSALVSRILEDYFSRPRS